MKRVIVAITIVAMLSFTACSNSTNQISSEFETDILMTEATTEETENTTTEAEETTIETEETTVEETSIEDTQAESSSEDNAENAYKISDINIPFSEDWDEVQATDSVAMYKNGMKNIVITCSDYFGIYESLDDFTTAFKKQVTETDNANMKLTLINESKATVAGVDSTVLTFQNETAGMVMLQKIYYLKKGSTIIGFQLTVLKDKSEADAADFDKIVSSITIGE